MSALRCLAWIAALTANAFGAAMPANTWVRIGAPKSPPQAFCDLKYCPAVGEFVIWGKVGGHRHESKLYEVQSLSPAKPGAGWRENLPVGKEQSWAGGRFPNWGCGCHRLRYKPDRPWLTNVRDRWVGNSGATNVIEFVQADGVTRPTRGLTFHHVAYDSKRGRMVYYVGGKTFAYDPKGRTWTDLKAAPPLACESLAWASMVYDPAGDQLVLFGGGYALNLAGGAGTWLFDCRKNVWSPAKVKDGREPPLRCNTQMVYDPVHKLVVLAGGDALDRFLADTWVFDPAKMEWTERKPRRCPPPRDRWAGCYLDKAGVVLMLTPTRRRGAAVKGEAWTYDVGKNVWTPLSVSMPAESAEWITCDAAPDGTVVLAAPTVGTWACRLDPARAVDAKNPGVAPGTWVYNSRAASQVESLLKAPAPDREAVAQRLAALPVNTAVDSRYPGLLISRTWSSAAIDTDRGVVLYIGGGHCGYKGSDVARYDVGANRWTLSEPPAPAPFIYDHNGALFGWDYRRRPQAQHTYMWYAYDPISKMMVYCARCVGPRAGQRVLLSDDPAEAFAYDPKKHGSWTWLYDPVRNRWHGPIFGRPFRNGWHLALCGTPKGVFAKLGKAMYHADVTVAGEKAEVKWTRLHGDCPTGRGEFQPVVYDSKRQRLVYLAAEKGKAMRAWARGLDAAGWEELPLQDAPPPSREIVYDTANDCLIGLWPRRLRAMSFADHRWRDLDVALPKGSYGVNSAMVYDPVHKLCILLVPQYGNRSKTQTLLFRYRPPGAD